MESRSNCNSHRLTRNKLEAIRNRSQMVENDEEERLIDQGTTIKFFGYRLVMLSASSSVIELSFAIEAVNAIPALLQLGVPVEFAAYLWCISPLLGFLIQPYLGYLSDTCTSSWGRRRPFMIIYFLLMSIGLGIAAFSTNIGYAIDSNHSKVAIAFAFVGFTLLDFFRNSLEVVSRAYLMDASTDHFQQLANSIFTIMAANGGILCYAINGISWKYSLGKFVGGQFQAVGTICLILMTIMMATSLISMPEKLSYAGCHTNQGSRSSIASNIDDSYSDGESDISLSLSQHSHPSSIIRLQRYTAHHSHYFKVKEIYSSIIGMPHELRKLSLTCFLGWSSFLNFLIYYTDYVGQEIYNGDPTAPINSTSHHLYIQGVMTASWGLIGYMLVSVIYSFMIESIIIQFGPAVTFSCSFAVVGLAIGIMTTLDSVAPAITLAAFQGISFAINYSVSYALLGEYHKYFKEEEDSRWEHREFGIDISILLLCMYLAQILVAFVTGAIIYATNSPITPMIMSSISALCCAIAAAFLDRVPINKF
ncbi:Membrane-associated transporter protein [Trichoplax sp. H2]|uniref:Uncharacterized protein n=2 Tax=Trichoplax adhaerens TaxID=10228 RepID=B3RQC1_TRIAD|nr:hypothetical protein TRIADDRAFT_53852 [Trichoplax adhaerens]EDV27804.1 hypothetical protein TRIADDRAFT_53852 [Trichoplax adhaerens]RDD45629.1 Membrane-associated transporter protein [Trichoplax sp. H2]|eukprot:XP_002109638.1 hypothetical protein TRIADDRAFT_53852 [Trichoplax adhaerens]